MSMWNCFDMWNFLEGEKLYFSDLDFKSTNLFRRHDRFFQNANVFHAKY